MTSQASMGTIYPVALRWASLPLVKPFPAIQLEANLLQGTRAEGAQDMVAAPAAPRRTMAAPHTTLRM